MNMKKCISLFLCIVFILLLSANHTVIADEYSQNFISESIVEKLFDKRSQLILEHKYDELEEIDKELEKFGIKRVEIAEVHEKIKELNEVPYVDLPHSSNVHWFSERRNVRRNGKKYEIQTLFAQPLNESSSLFNAKKKALL